jgi:RNA polymerase sigma-70 factor (ECF subfamily)
MNLTRDSKRPSQTSADQHVAVAQADNQGEFGGLIEPYRRELQAYCYRLLGSPLDAEDAVQETMLRAWRGRAGFRQAVSFRAWLYKIATNTCLNTLERRPRRRLPMSVYPAADPLATRPAPIYEPIWLEPYPDDWLPDNTATPEARYGERESLSLAFLTALQLLPPRQRAVLILREVLDWQASETADLLSLTVAAVNSALHRARTTLAKHYPGRLDETGRGRADDPETQRLLDRYVRAWETADIAGLVALLREDAALTMPPIPSWYQGREAIASLLAAGVFAGAEHGWEWRLRTTGANGQPALAIYRRAEAGEPFRAFTLQVLVIDPASGQVSALINFLNPALLECFGLPVELAAE